MWTITLNQLKSRLEEENIYIPHRKPLKNPTDPMNYLPKRSRINICTIEPTDTPANKPPFKGVVWRYWLLSVCLAVVIRPRIFVYSVPKTQKFFRFCECDPNRRTWWRTERDSHRDEGIWMNGLTKRTPIYIVFFASFTHCMMVYSSVFSC